MAVVQREIAPQPAKIEQEPGVSVRLTAPNGALITVTLPGGLFPSDPDEAVALAHQTLAQFAISVSQAEKPRALRRDRTDDALFRAWAHR